MKPYIICLGGCLGGLVVIFLIMVASPFANYMLGHGLRWIF